MSHPELHPDEPPRPSGTVVRSERGEWAVVMDEVEAERDEVEVGEED